MKNNIQSASMTIKNTSGNNLEVALNKAKTSYKFEFDENKIKKVKINVKARSNLEEVDLVEEYFTPKERKNLEKQMSDIIKKQIEGVINKAKKLDIDFFNFEENILNKKHPYKYEKMKNNIKNIWNEAEIEIKIEPEIERN